MTPEQRAHLAEHLKVAAIDYDAAVAYLNQVDTRLANLGVWVDQQPEPPPVDPPDGATWRLPIGSPTSVLWGQEAGTEIKKRFTGSASGGGVDPSGGVKFTSDGGMEYHADPAKRTDSPNSGGANWINGALPLANPGTDVELRYTITTPTGPRAFGRSMKLPGLETITGDQEWPGGGYTGKGQMIARAVISDWNGDNRALIGPYAYWPYQADAGSQTIDPPHGQGSSLLWHPPRSGWSLWWYANSNAWVGPGETVEVSLRAQRQPDGGWRITHTTNDNTITYSYAAHPDNPKTVTHLALNFMYGGETAAYGPDGRTVTRCEDFEIITRAA